MVMPPKTLHLHAATDAELAHAIAARNVSALDLIYSRHSTLVYTIALKILKRPQEAEDLTQEVFLKLWRDQKYQPQRGSLRSFLATLTRSRAIDRLRVQNNQLKILQKWHPSVPSQPTTPMEEATWSEQQALIQAALKTLPPKYQQILELSYFNGYSQSEIAQQLDLPLGTVKTWARKGLLLLRKQVHAFRIGTEQ